MPAAVTVKLAEVPVHAAWLTGPVVMDGEVELPHPGGMVAVMAEVLNAPVVVSALPSIVTPVAKSIAPLLQTIVPLNSE